MTDKSWFWNSNFFKSRCYLANDKPMTGCNFRIKWKQKSNNHPEASSTIWSMTWRGMSLLRLCSACEWRWRTSQFWWTVKKHSVSAVQGYSTWKHAREEKKKIKIPEVAQESSGRCAAPSVGPKPHSAREERRCYDAFLAPLNLSLSSDVAWFVWASTRLLL